MTTTATSAAQLSLPLPAPAAAASDAPAASRPCWVCDESGVSIVPGDWYRRDTCYSCGGTGREAAEAEEGRQQR